MKELDSYLNDHLAGSVGALELIGHWATAHKGEPLGAFFADLQGEVKADQDTLCSVMGSLRVEESKVRQAGAWIAEKVGREAGPDLLAAGQPGGQVAGVGQRAVDVGAHERARRVDGPPVLGRSQLADLIELLEFDLMGAVSGRGVDLVLVQ